MQKSFSMENQDVSDFAATEKRFISFRFMVVIPDIGR